MNAGRILQRAGYDTEALRVRLTPVDPDQINVYPASKLMRRMWRSGIKGVTFRNLVFVDPEFIKGDPRRLARLVIHELVHVRQYSDQGYIPFSARYLYEFGRGLLSGKGVRGAYLDIGAEREARHLTETIEA